ncbi:MAG: carboxypeptidase regulatory-like domain-containing protein [Terriglobales bacterium]
MKRIRYQSLIFLFAMLATLGLVLTAAGQTLTTGGISGHVLDPSGAAIPGATVVVTSVTTGAVRTVVTDTTGHYTVSQLPPGHYTIKASAKGFQSQVSAVAVSISSVARTDFKLPVGSETQTVEVSATSPIISTSNPNTTTTVTARQVSLLPNPGGDLTYEAQVAPGAVMNTTGGYGNAEFNGLPATSVNYTIDGMDANDPFLNLNNSGATNELLGLNAVQQVSINTLSYSVAQGRQDGAQVNYVTKSGGNQIHGDLYEIWNDAYMNANDYFNNMTDSPRPNGHVSNFGGAIGGPLIHNKLFYYLDVEASRIALPVTQSVVSPSPAFEQYVTNTLASGATAADPGVKACGPTGTGQCQITANPATIPFYQKMWGLYPSGGTPAAIADCPASLGADGCALQQTLDKTNATGQTYVLYRMDDDISANNTVWFKYDQNLGTQATYTDPLNAVFNVYSYQPERDGEAEWTHIFSPNVLNVLNTGFTWYSAIFQPTNNAAATAAFPYFLTDNFAPGFTNVGGEDYVWPQGRNVTQWQVIDNVSWIHGNHSFSFGENLKRDDVSDHDFGFYNTPYVAQNNMTEYEYGAANFFQQSFPVTLSEPIAVTLLDMYAGDTWQMTPGFTLDYGIRASWNEDPVNQHNLFSYPSTSFFQMSHALDQPMNEAVVDGKSLMLPATPLIMWQPRIGFSWQFAPKTILRGGFGLFSDIFPAVLADSMAENPPYYNVFDEGIGLASPYQLVTGLGPTVSAADAAAAANAAVVSGYSSGAPSCAAAGAPADCFPTGIGLNTLPSSEMHYPYAMEYSLGIERQFGQTWGLTVQWVGTQSRQSPYTVPANAYETACAGCFSPLPSAPPDQRFSGVTQYETGSNSDYNGLQATLKKTFGNGLSFDANYTWSHCLDTISNGSGFATFGGANNSQQVIYGNLGRYYGDCDYDIRHNFSGSYVYTLPIHGHHGVLGDLIDGWGISGTLFIHSGLPMTVVSSPSASLVNTGGVLQFASLAPNTPEYSQGVSVAGVTPSYGYQWLNPAAFTDACTGTTPATCQFGDLGRNSVRGPGFVWSDFFLTKEFRLTEKYRLRIDGQFYNVFNHPNFGNNGNGAIGTEGLGYITNMANPPTGLLGSGLGGDTAVRMIALQGKVTF